MTTTGPSLVVFDRKLLEEKTYWIKQLSGFDPRSGLRLDHPRSADYAPAIGMVEIDLDNELCAKLSELTGNGLFLINTTLMAALKICLHKYTGSRTLVVGSPARKVEGRADRAANLLAIATEIDDHHSFRQFLLSVRETLLAAYAHQHYPFRHLVADLELEETGDRCPLADVVLQLREIHSPLPDLKNDLTFTFSKTADQLYGEITFNQNLFERETIARLSGHFVTILNAALQDPNRRICDLQLASEPERQKLLAEWNATQINLPQVRCLHQFFEAQVERDPDAIAVVFEGETVNYQELNRRANQLAHYLESLGVGPEVKVGICVERSVDLVIGMLGVLKAGGAFLPLDPSYPYERLVFMLEDSQVAVLLTKQALAAHIPELECKIVCLDSDRFEIAGYSDQNPDSEVQADNLAYIIYTSGSTGRPKGAMLEHRGVANLTEAQRRTFNLHPGLRVLQFASFSFDASIFEMVMALCVGAALHLERVENLLPGPGFVQRLDEQAITNVTLPPTVLAALPEAALPQLQTIVVAGEACSADLANRWAAGRRFFNAYGPTEATIWATVAECLAGGETPTIGRPIANTQVYLLDQYLQPVPVGVAGEIHLGGMGLGRGYLNRPELSAEKFIPNPFANEAGTRLYKTGDLARFRADGEIEFLGRIDHQVKVRGYRIELGEIEAVLAQVPGVRETLVLAREDAPGDVRLVAYVVPRSGETLLASPLRALLREQLPEYMLPSAFVILDEFPLTPNGKIARRALPSPDRQRPDLEAAYQAPRNSIEEQVAAIWAEILEVKQVGVFDNFFQLGGHSLLATQVISRVCETFGIELELRLLFQEPTVAGLAAAISAALDKAYDNPLQKIERIDRRNLPALVDSVDQMDVSQIDSLLNRLLAETESSL